jgi:hypothetical protein
MSILGSRWGVKLVQCDHCQSDMETSVFNLDCYEPKICRNCFNTDMRKRIKACTSKCSYPACDIWSCGSKTRLSRTKVGHLQTTINPTCKCKCHIDVADQYRKPHPLSELFDE